MCRLCIHTGILLCSLCIEWTYIHIHIYIWHIYIYICGLYRLFGVNQIHLLVWPLSSIFYRGVHWAAVYAASSAPKIVLPFILLHPSFYRPSFVLTFLSSILFLFITSSLRSPPLSLSLSFSITLPACLSLSFYSHVFSNFVQLFSCSCVLLYIDFFPHSHKRHPHSSSIMNPKQSSSNPPFPRKKTLPFFPLHCSLQHTSSSLLNHAISLVIRSMHRYHLFLLPLLLFPLHMYSLPALQLRLP